jgi:predicted O-linked N-acetylglucosamine transferase (SPINDLY family)
MKHPYYIVASSYTPNSEGVRALHHLCDALNAAGQEAWLYLDGWERGELNPALNTPLLDPGTLRRHEEEGRNGIGVYPEVVTENILYTPVVVHWMLNKDGLICGKKINAREGDLFFYYHSGFVPEPGKDYDYLSMPLHDVELFKPAPHRMKHGPLLYVNRIPETEIDLSLFPPDIEILSNQRPVSLLRLAEKLQGATRLYTYELSGTCCLAMLCGCPVVSLEHPRYAQFAYTPELMALLPEGILALSDAPEEIERARKHLPKLREETLRRQSKCQTWLGIFIQKTQAAAQSAVPGSVQAIAAFQSGNFERAIALLTPLLEKEPENPLPPAYLAFIAAEQGEPLAAADFIETAARIAPDCADLKAALGESFLKAERPDLAAKYLEEAIAAQPDLWIAYPAYAQSLHLTGQSEAAVALLRSAVIIPSPAETHIQNVLFEILSQQGDLGEVTRSCLRFSRGLIDDLLAVRCLSHFDPDGQRLLEALGRIQQRQLADVCAVRKDQSENRVGSQTEHSNLPLKIAFLIGDFARERSLGRLPALLCHLPPEKFHITLFINDPHYAHEDNANLCALLAGRGQPIFAMNDADALGALHAAAPDILIDLDAYGPAERLAVFLKAEVPHKFLWGEAPMPPLSPQCRVLTGARLESVMLPCVTLPEMGEYCDLPELPLDAPAVRASEGTPLFGVLTPAIRIDREGWRLFAALLHFHPGSRLLINLARLGKAAQDFIGGVFVGAGVAVSRLRFVHAHTAEELCRFWQEADLGLAPPTDAGDLALPASLWMGRPYLALASPLPWSRRPAAFLELAGAGEWICQTPEDYIERARSIPSAPNPQFRARMKEAGIHDPRIFAQGFAESIG